jgi:Protein of unknown function (DUF4245)
VLLLVMGTPPSPVLILADREAPGGCDNGHVTGPARKPDRSSLTVRHMAAAVGLLVAIVVVLGLVSRGAGFAPGGPTVDDSRLPTVDAPAELGRRQASTPFPLRVPAVPAGWRANSAGVDPVGPGHRAVRVGYVTPDAAFVQVQQTDAPEEAVLAAASGARVLAAQGPQDVAGQRWTVYGTRPGEPVWIADTGAVRWVVTGTGTDDEFRALAAAVRSGAPAAR